jgi:serine/threonine-protein phosphatase 6 regulatory subunit 3
MSLMSRQPGYGPVYDEQGRLQGGLSALEELARVIANGGTPREEEDRDVGASGVADSRELPMSIDSTDCSSIMSDEDDEDYASSTGDEEDLADSSDPERIDNPTRTEANGISSTPPPLALPPPEPITISSPVVAPASPPLAIGSDDPDLALRTPLPPSLPDDPFIDPSSIPSSPVSDPHPLQNSDASTSLENSTPSPDSILNSANVPPEPLQPGDQLKKRFLDLGVLSTLLVQLLSVH